MSSCTCFDNDQVILVKDFGPKGLPGPITTLLTHGLAPGGSVTVVASSDHEFDIDINNEKKDTLLRFRSSPYKDEEVFNTLYNCSWGADERPSTRNSIQKGVRAAVTIVYEACGYRIFINGKEQHFYKHRVCDPAFSMECLYGQFYKIVYTTPIAIPFL